MKAIVYEKSGNTPVLALRDVEKQIPGEGQVLVQIIASSVNAADYRSMKLGIIPKRKIFGTEIAGRVEAVGNGVTKFKIGDEVFGDIFSCGMGGFAETVAADEKVLSFKPASVSFETAAAIPMAGVTALQGLRDLGKIRAGQKVLICGAGGGVGMFAVQLAKVFGAEVTAVCGTHNVETVKALGADHVIDYSKRDFTKESERYDLILAVNGRYPLSAYRRALAPGGIFVMVGGALSQILKSLLLGWLLSIGSKKMRFLAGKTRSADQDYLIHLVEEGKIQVLIDRRYPLEQVTEAMRTMGEGHARGKVVIRVADESAV